VTIISPERRYTRGWSGVYVLARCNGCGAVAWTYLSNLMRGVSQGCQQCSQPRQIPIRLDRRLTSAKSRCTNLNDPAWKNYGGRGIEFRFASILDAGLWVIKNIGLPARGAELDRRDNDGHYEPGNLRWRTRSQQMRNTRCAVLPEDWAYLPEQWPYARFTVERLLRSGLTREEVLERAELAVEERRKGWRGIAARLEHLIS
jgi:hypothetical protein